MKKIFNCKNILFILLAVFCVSLLMPIGMLKVDAAIIMGPTDAFYNMDNYHYTFQTIDGGTVTSQAQEKPKLLLFINVEDGESQNTIRALCLVSEYKGVDIVAIETSGATKAQVTAFANKYANGKDYVEFCYSTAGYHDYMWKYIEAVEPERTGSGLPILVYIDANDKIQCLTMSLPTTQEIIDNLNTYCNAGILNQRPDITKISNVVSGVHVYWKATEAADAYDLLRREAGSEEYYWITTTTSAHYIDKTAQSGKTYEYYVYELIYEGNDTYMGASSKVVTTTFVATPDITLRVNRASGVGLGWDKIQGATGYAIYRKPYSGNAAWTRVATITNPNTTKWDDTSVKANNGTIYRYTIRALAGENRNILSGCRSTGRTMVRLTSRTLNSATKASATSIKCSWGTTAQATGYEVRFMVGSTVYKTYTIGNYKTGVKTFTGLKAGQTYKIQVRSYKKVDGVGSFYSAWSTAKTVSL